MTGVLNLLSTGIILAETCEAYLNGWAFDKSGSTTALGSKINLAHSGAGAFQLETLNSWPASAYARFTQSLALGTGANRLTRVFRGPGLVASIMDDFPGSSIDATKWSAVAVSAANSACDISPGGSITVLSAFRPATNTYYKYFARVKVNDGAVGGVWQVFFIYEGSYNKLITIHFADGAGGLTGHIVLETSSSAKDTLTDCGAIGSGFHNYKVTWAAGVVTLYCDGVQIGACNDTSIPAPDVSNQGIIYFAGPAVAHTFYVDAFGYLNGTNLWKASYAIGSQTIYDQDVQTEAHALDNGFFDTGWIAVTPTGTQTLELKVRNASGAADARSAQVTFDDLIIMLNKTITIKALIGGQKVDLLDAGGSVRKTVTCAATGVDAIISDISDLINTAYGFSGHFNVYDTDGVTLLFTSTTAPVWGGDVYQWVPNQSQLDVSVDHTQIYRAGSGLSPGTAVATVTLTNKDTGAPLSGKSVTFTPNLGSCAPTSANTDVNGHAATTFTPGSSAGLGGVRVDFAGDATYAPSSVLQLVDVYYAAIVVDASKDFQVFIEGQEEVVSAGNYMLATDFRPQAFSLTTPSMDLSVGGWWYIEIYRRGTLEFSGRILKRRRVGGINPQLTITGVDEKLMMQRRVANRSYLDDPKCIIQDLLTLYPCGITAGAISLYGSVIKLAATYSNLFDALVQIAQITGWHFRLNANRTLDFAPSFGALQLITIATGGNEAAATHDEDWTKVDTKVYVVGATAGAALVGTASDPTATLVFGLIEEAFLEKALSTQGTVDLRAQTLLSQLKAVQEIITVDWVDTLATGSYAVYDVLTVTDADTGLSGTYTVQTLQRDLADANKAQLALTQRVLTMADAIQLIRKTVQDIGVL